MVFSPQATPPLTLTGPGYSAKGSKVTNGAVDVGKEDCTEQEVGE